MRKSKFWLITGFCYCALLFLRADCFAFSEPKVFNGVVDFAQKSFIFNFDLKESGAIEIKGDLNPAGEYYFNLSLKHLKLKNTDILTEFYVKGNIDRAVDGRIKSLKGTAWTERSLLNYKPLKEFQLGYEVEKGNFKINSFSWAQLSLRGAISWASGLNFDLDLAADNADIGPLVAFLGIGAGRFNSEGKVSGNFKISRPPKIRLSADAAATEIIGRLTASPIRIRAFNFNNARVNLEGLWPIARLNDSRITTLDGLTYDLKGQVNLEQLADLGHPDNKVTVCSTGDAIAIQEWVIKRKGSGAGQEYLEAEHSLKKNQALKMRIKDQSETLAWEKSVKF